MAKDQPLVLQVFLLFTSIEFSLFDMRRTVLQGLGFGLRVWNCFDTLAPPITFIFFFQKGQSITWLK